MGQDLFVVWLSLHASVCQRQKVFAPPDKSIARPAPPSFLIYSGGIKHVIKLSTRYGLIKNRNYTSFNNGSKTQLPSYLTGLIEGDGTIHVPKTERSDKGNYNYPSIQIVFHLKDLRFGIISSKRNRSRFHKQKKGC
jgi:hypothetical protein